MELENLKTAWTSVDERLEKKEILNAEMISETLKNKSNKLLKKLKMEEFSTILIIPMFSWLLISNLRRSNDIFPQIMTALFVLLIFIICFMRVYAYLKYLRKIDFAKNIKDNIDYAYRYGVVYRRIKMTMYLLPITFIGLFIRQAYVYDMSLAYWITMFVISGVFMVVVAISFYRSIYRNIRVLKESLAELSELEEN